MNDSVREITATSFAPILYLKDVAAAIEFYIKAFDAIELHRWSNDDGSVHVAEMSIQTAVFHLHEEVARDNQLSPLTLGGASVVIGLFRFRQLVCTDCCIRRYSNQRSPGL